MFFTRAARFMLAWSLMGRRSELRIAPSAASAARNDHAVINGRKVVDFFFGYFVVDDGADRNLQDDILPITASPVRAFAVASAFRVVLRIKSKVEQSIVPAACLHNDVAAAPTISTRRAST